MENRLFEYMNRRLSGEVISEIPKKEPGPVITISRQTGCGARGIAWAICQELNKQKPAAKNENPWRFISREILQESAEKLNLDPAALQHVVDDKDRGIMDQIVGALSTHSFKSDQKILKTVQDVIRQFGHSGKVVIIGRGGASICSDIKKSVHIRLVAPEEWRIAEIARRLDYSKAFATQYVRKRDAERELLITRLLGKKPDSLAYDIEINRSRFTDTQLAELIIQLATIKEII
jgi:cytidylate kinase